VRAAALVHPILALLLAPLLPGIIQRTKAFFGGRRGPPLLQPYRDLIRLLGKGFVFSETTSWVFAGAPLVGLAAVAAALLLVGPGGQPAVVAFPGDFVLLVYLLGVGRFFTVVGALDTGSSFEGMGASREVAYSALAEPALLVALAVLARATGSLSLSGMAAGMAPEAWRQGGPAFVLVGAVLLAVFLAENARIPVDDPATHLELTMIHEVMVLDHGGPDLAFLMYGAALKLWVMGAVLVGILLPLRTGHAGLDTLAFVGGMILLAVVVGVIESAMARLRLARVPQFLVGALALAMLALVLIGK
jgi:formate hydrogenlyase subunit 4